MTPNSVVLTIQKPNNFSLVEISGPDSTLLLEPKKAASPKQFTWLLFLRAYRALTCVSWLATASRAVLRSIRKRIAQSDLNEEEPQGRAGSKLYKFIKVFLFIAIFGLVLEVIAHFRKWNLYMIQPSEVEGLLHSSYMAWLSFRADYISPLVMRLSEFCVVLFLIQSLDRLVLCLGCFYIKYKKVKPVIADDGGLDLEDLTSFPMVLVQIPMCNEREVYAQSIAAACELDWPKDRILIQ
ncbi:hypothetical protein CRG98_045254, partial [Punica granatum]